ncbi:response regulator [Parasediminibacterium sp. JCM 36343]|uniref:response regulator n=1 Tax=Parasediminibacterium sp. JCM 36343 TaxID=3374279 RepID=UPI00397DA4E0
MSLQHFNLLLADDDQDDCLIFKDALDGLIFPFEVHVSIVNDGEQLMRLLAKQTTVLPHALFLDLNMPRKNGIECLLEIKANEKLKSLPVIILSTSFEQKQGDFLFKSGAQYYIRKPIDFTQLKKVLQQALTLIAEEHIPPPSKDNFLLTGT